MKTNTLPRWFLSFSVSLIAFLSMANPAVGQDQPTIAKDSVQVTAFTLNVHKGNYDVWSWIPRINYRVNGPISSGSQLYVEFTVPGTAPWVKFDCHTEPVQPGYWWKTECGGRDIPEDKGILYTGPVSFAIKMRNELMGADSTLFNGKMKVAKARTNEVGPKAAKKFVYYVDHDWNLPIGYVYLEPDGVYAWKKPTLHVSFWIRGEATRIEPHLFYQGKEVGKIFYEGTEVGKAGCSSEVENNTTHYVDDSLPQKAKWARVRCTFYNIRGRDETGESPGMFTPPHLLSSNPGDYEFKILWNNRLARSIKFTVAPGGKFDNGIATSNKLGTDRVIVPVQILGDQDGTWDRMGWKEAFYGNPVTGFTAVP